MLVSKMTIPRKMVYWGGATVNPKETFEDIVLQIWNDGAEGVFYEKNDFKEFKRRIRKSLNRGKPKRKCKPKSDVVCEGIHRDSGVI